MKSSGDDSIGLLILLLIFLFLCTAVVIFGVILVVLVALLFLGWVLTYWLLRIINDLLTDNLVTESEGLLALIIPAVLWAGLTWWFIPRGWVWAIAYYFGWPILKTWLSVIIATGLIGLGFGFSALFMLESRGDDNGDSNRNNRGGSNFPDGEITEGWNDENWDLLSEGVLLGEDYK